MHRRPALLVYNLFIITNPSLSIVYNYLNFNKNPNQRMSELFVEKSDNRSGFSITHLIGNEKFKINSPQREGALFLAFL